MLDLNLLHALKSKKRYQSLFSTVPADSFSRDTMWLLSTYAVYFKAYPDDTVVDFTKLETMVKLKSKLSDEQRVVIKALFKSIHSSSIDEGTVAVTLEQLEDQRYAAEVGMLYKRWEDGEELDLQSEVHMCTEAFRKRRELDHKAGWCDDDVELLIERDADDSGYVLDFLPAQLHENLKGLNVGDNVAIAAPTDKGKTSLLCNLAVSFAKQHKKFVADGTEERFRPVLYLVNEGMAERITPRIYQTALGLTRDELSKVAKVKGKLLQQYLDVVGRRDAIRVVNIHGANLADVARIIEAHDPFLVITDMTGRINAVGVQGANDIQQLEIVWNSLRCYTAMYKFIHVGTVQISNEGMDTLYPPLTALQNSKVAIQTTLDLGLWVGAYLQPTEEVEMMRGISTPKNKLAKSGCKSMNKVETYFEAERNIWR